MQQATRPDIAMLEEALDAVQRDVRALVDGLSETVGTWRADSTTWSVAECLDHLAVANRVYLRAMEPPAQRAFSQGRRRRGPAVPGVIGRLFIRTQEPPVKPRFKGKAPQAIRPRRGPSLRDALEQFLVSHEEVRAFLRRYADIDLTGVRFPNPFVRGIRFSLATGLHVMAAHERRHVWQARHVRHAAESSMGRRGQPNPS